MTSVEFAIARAADAAAIADVYSPYVRDTFVSFETEPPDADEMAMRIDRVGPQYPWIKATADGELIGYAYACENRARLAYRWSVDVAVYVRLSAQRKGVGGALYRRLFALLRAQGYVNAFAGISLPNVASVALHEALGFVPVGVYRRIGYKLGAWRDVGWWQLVLREPPTHPAEPVSIAQLNQSTTAAILEGRAAPTG
ncbi:MAG TPA: arsinothricin resistance N-acetyltransferase ArsN1 family B [Rhodanobacteraceae bacterium]